MIGSLLKSAKSRLLAGYGEVPQSVHDRAQEIEHTTGLNYTQAFVMAADERGIDDGLIEREMAPSGRTARQVRESLRSEKLDLEGEAERTKRALDSWSG